MSDTISNELSRQRDGIDAWMLSDEGRRVAAHLLRRRGLDRPGDELVNEAWMKVQRSFERRSEPYPQLDEPRDFARFGSRVLDNLSRDWLRAVRRAGEVELASAATIDDTAFDNTETRLLLEQLLMAVSVRAQRRVGCVGCPDEVAVAAALEVVHMALSGQEGSSTGRSWIDKMLHTALDRVDGDTNRSVEARNQRKSRCGRCATGLLKTALTDVVGVAP
jgi:DNA-directed RNA polymerase specialized sigma24 family protein